MALAENGPQSTGIIPRFVKFECLLCCSWKSHFCLHFTSARQGGCSALYIQTLGCSQALGVKCPIAGICAMVQCARNHVGMGRFHSTAFLLVCLSWSKEGRVPCIIVSFRFSAKSILNGPALHCDNVRVGHRLTCATLHQKRSVLQLGTQKSWFAASQQASQHLDPADIERSPALDTFYKLGLKS